MGRHSKPTPPQPAPASNSAPVSDSAPRSRRFAPAQWALALFLIVAFILSIISAVLLWPSSDPVDVSPDFAASSSLPQDIADGTVAVVTPGACGSPDVGKVFDGSPQEPAATAPTAECTRAIIDLTSGDDKGKRTLTELSGQPGDPQLEVGEKVRLNRHTRADGTTGYAFNDYRRDGHVIFWLIITALAMVVVGGWRGARSLVGLILTMVVLGIFLLPALLRGGEPILLATTACALILTVVIYLVHGMNWKSSAAIGGTLIALGLATTMAQWGIIGSRLHGLGDDDNLLVQLYLPDVSVRGLLLAGFIIGAIGALNDATVAQASTVTELKKVEPHAPKTAIFRSAMSVGRDHIASMLYTLILSYTGAALPMLLILSVANRPLWQVLTSDMMATEIVRSAVGAIALVLAVPITTLIAAFVVTSDTPVGHSHGGVGHTHDFETDH